SPNTDLLNSRTAFWVNLPSFKMADEEKEYTYCVLCRKNHNQGRKHVYSKKHKYALDNVLLKFGKKVEEVLKYLRKPCVEDGELEPGAKFWCHFCRESCNKHVTDREVSIYYGGVFEHFASQEHHKNVHRFWREHGAEKDRKNMFLIDKEQFISFKEGVDKVLREHEAVLESNHQKEAEKIKQMEVEQKLASLQPPEIRNQRQQIIYKTVQNEYGILQNPTGWHEGCRVWGGGIFKYRQGSDQWFPSEMDLNDGVAGQSNACMDSLSVQTDIAFSENLKCINPPELNPGEGNVHTGATPPWLKDDDDTVNTCASTEIGPSLEYFKKHVKRMKKASQNPNRVGANFDREKETGDEW
ncbi:hypothetical protein QZH41_020290, partial [Actinostola sp. cb2023]